jgi:hypothetical protein
MTAVVAITVAAGVVLAADSRSAICEDSPRGRRVLSTYDGAEKLVTWGRSLGALCVGAGSIGGLPLSQLLRRAVPRAIAKAGAEAVCWRLREALGTEIAAPAIPAHNPRPTFTILVAGYGSAGRLPQCWRLACNAGVVAPPEPDQQRLIWAGDGAEPIARLVDGHAGNAEVAIGRAGLDPDRTRLVLRRIADHCGWQPIHPEMPLADAADLAHGLIRTCLDVARFSRVVPTVGGRIVVRRLSPPG